MLCVFPPPFRNVLRRQPQCTQYTQQVHTACKQQGPRRSDCRVSLIALSHMHTYIHTYTYTHTNTHTHTNTRTYTRTYTHSHAHTLHSHAYAHAIAITSGPCIETEASHFMGMLGVCIFVSTCVCEPCTHTHTQTHTNTHTHIHTHTHTHTRA